MAAYARWYAQGAVRASAQCIADSLSAAGYRPGVPLVVACIGTDRCIGDALGPFVAETLHRAPEVREAGTLVAGGLAYPLHAHRLEPFRRHLLLWQKRTGERLYVLAVDASLGDEDRIGSVLISPGPFWPGSSLRALTRPLGDAHILGVVGRLCASPHRTRPEALQENARTLQGMRLQPVVQMASFIAESIRMFLQDAKPMAKDFLFQQAAWLFSQEIL